MSLGYRVVSYDIASLKASTLMERKPVDLSIGSVHEFSGGLFLGTNLEFTEYYLGNTDGEDVILTFEFDDNDIIQGDLSPNGEVLVKKGKLVEARFENGDLQHKYGHLLNPDHYVARRSTDRGNALSQTIGNKSVAVVRAMDARSRHIQPMDYVYTLPSGAFYATAKRVLSAYEEGEQVRPRLEKALIKTLEHAVTTAVYECETQRVGFGVTSSESVYKASNEGEFFYDGSSPLPVKMLFEVSPEGNVTLVEKERDMSVGLEH